jgi:hypothetical protein
MTVSAGLENVAPADARWRPAEARWRRPTNRNDRPALAVGRLGERRLRLFFDCSSIVWTRIRLFFGCLAVV